MSKEVEERLMKEVEQYYKRKNKVKTTKSKLQEEAQAFVDRKTKDGQEK